MVAWEREGNRVLLRGRSIEPNMIVTFERRPTECATRCTSSHSSVFTLSGHRIARTSSSRISAAVPGIVSSPASRALIRKSSKESPVRLEPLTISIGENACTCIDGTRALTARTRSA